MQIPIGLALQLRPGKGWGDGRILPRSVSIPGGPHPPPSWAFYPRSGSLPGVYYWAQCAPQEEAQAEHAASREAPRGNSRHSSFPASAFYRRPPRPSKGKEGAQGHFIVGSRAGTEAGRSSRRLGPPPSSPHLPPPAPHRVLLEPLLGSVPPLPLGPREGWETVVRLPVEHELRLLLLEDQTGSRTGRRAGGGVQGRRRGASLRLLRCCQAPARQAARAHRGALSGRLRLSQWERGSSRASWLPPPAGGKEGRRCHWLRGRPRGVERGGGAGASGSVAFCLSARACGRRCPGCPPAAASGRAWRCTCR